MKRWLTGLLMVMVLLSLCACGETGGTGDGGSSAVPAEPQKVTFEAQYIRTNGYRDVEFPQVTLIRSVEELTAYYEQNKELYDLKRREVPPNTVATVGFLDACDIYDAAFFADHVLLLILHEEGSGSIRHTVTEVMAEKGQLTVSVERYSPWIHSDDMAEWHFFVEVDKTVAPAMAEDVTVEFTFVQEKMPEY